MLSRSSLGEAVRNGQLAQCQQELLQHLQVAVQDVFSTMLSTMGELVPCTPPPVGNVSEPGTVSIEAVVAFSGPASGAVVLRCTPGAAADITRGLLMLGEGETVEIAEVRDALGECANMVTGVLKTRALDPHGEYRLAVPTIGTHVDSEQNRNAGRLVYRLAQGAAAVEIWLADTGA